MLAPAFLEDACLGVCHRLYSQADATAHVLMLTQGLTLAFAPAGALAVLWIANCPSTRLAQVARRGRAGAVRSRHTCGRV